MWPEIGGADNISYLIPLQDVKSATTIGIGSQIFAIGYPAGIKLDKTNFPIAKSGYISSPLSGKIELTTSVLNHANRPCPLTYNCKFFLVDGLIIGGNSGSPIVNPNETKYRISNGQIQFTQNPIPNLIIGIVSSGMNGTGISIIFPSDYILELVNAF